MTTIQLKNSIKAHGRDVTELTLREPIGNDLMAVGEPPFSLEKSAGGGTTIRINAKATGALIAQCADIPLSSVGLLSLTDFMAAQVAILDFFGGATGAP